jgi:ankyrin repeat protein/radical SAM superfamily enzyme YgiQ (UPF0313 family)
MHVLLVGPEKEENLSIRYLSSSLLASGHEVDIVSFNSACDIDAVVSATSNVDLVGLSMCFQSRAREYLELARRIKKAKPTCYVLAGGHYASCAAKDLLEHHAELDSIVIHEGEQTIVEIADAGDKLPQRVQQIKGIAYRMGNDIHFTEPRSIIQNLDSLPQPDRRGSVRLLAGVPTASMVGSRGCYGSCDYCCVTTLHRLAPGKRFRQRSVENIADEMATLYSERGIRQFIFHDDNFLVPSVHKNQQRLDDFANALSIRGVRDIAFAIKCRPHDVDQDVLVKLKEMGLLRVFLGIESGSSLGLSSIGRKQTIAESERALRICKDLGISSQYVIMAFHPGATIDTIRTDITFMREYIDHPLSLARVEALAGTPLEKRLVDDGRAKGNYLARCYHLLDPAADLVCSIATRKFLKRCWADDNLMDFAVGMEHLSEVMKHFFTGEEVNVLQSQIHSWCLEVNRNSLDLLQRLVDICSSDPRLLNKSTRNKIHDLLEEETCTRTLFCERGENLRHSLEELTLSMVGIRHMGNETIKIPSRHGAIARHAAAVILALCVAGVVPSIGFSHQPEPPLEVDSDSDKLATISEEKIFGTNPQLADTDGDGVSDGDEDHDEDGIVNLEEFNNTVALIDALETGDTDKVKTLLDYSSDMPILDDDGMTPLTRASYHGHNETVQFLLNEGADVDARDNEGWTGLLRAAGGGHRQVIEILLTSGADVDARDNEGWTPLMWAVRRGYPETVLLLLHADADVNNKDKKGQTALMEAVGRNHVEVIKILLETGADVSAVNNSGKSALMVAKENNYTNIVELLLGANVEE